jgi:hypothetical protein
VLEERDGVAVDAPDVRNTVESGTNEAELAHGRVLYPSAGARR